MATRKEFIKMCIAAGSAILYGSISGCAKKKEPIDENPYKYDVDRFKQIDEKLILYEEVSSFNVEIGELKGFCISGNDTVYVADQNQIFIFDTSGNPKEKFELKRSPTCIAVRNDNEIYVGVRDHVEVYDSSGDLRKSWVSCGENACITCLSLREEVVALADFGNKKIWVFNAGGDLQFVISAGFVIPGPFFDVRFDSSGFIWVVNSGKLRIEQFSPSGKFIKSFGVPSMNIEGFTGCCNPVSFVILKYGEFVTIEKGIIRVKLYDQSGKFKGVIAGPDKFTEGARGIIAAEDSKGLIYIADPELKKIRKFKSRSKA